MINISIPGKAKDMFPARKHEDKFEKNLEELQKEIDEEQEDLEFNEIPVEIKNEKLTLSAQHNGCVTP